LAHRMEAAAGMLFDIDLVARQLRPAGIDELGRGDCDLGDKNQVGLRSLRMMARIFCASASLRMSPTGRSLRRPQLGYSRSVPGTLSWSISPNRSSTWTKAMAEPA